LHKVLGHAFSRLGLFLVIRSVASVRAELVGRGMQTADEPVFGTGEDARSMPENALYPDNPSEEADMRMPAIELLNLNAAPEDEAGRLRRVVTMPMDFLSCGSVTKMW